MKTGVENFKRSSHWITGEVQDTLIDRDGNVTVLPADHNIVVNSCSNLIACLFKNSAVEGDVPTGIKDSEGHDRLFTSAGIRYWAIGGIKTGDTETLPDIFSSQPEGTDKNLVKEIYRAIILPENIKFVNLVGKDEKGNNKYEETDSVTNMIKITITVPYDEGNGTWYEFGLFGGNSACADENSGIMINKKVHEPITKSVNLQIQRTVIFTF